MISDSLYRGQRARKSNRRLLRPPDLDTWDLRHGGWSDTIPDWTGDKKLKIYQIKIIKKNALGNSKHLKSLGRKAANALKSISNVIDGGHCDRKRRFRYVGGYSREV
jgi:hypothetical protein